MSLENPTVIEKGLALLKTKPVYIGLCCIAVLILAWYLLTQVQSCRSSREIDKMRANVNVALQAVNAAHDQVIQDKANENIAVQQAKAAVNAYVEAANVTDTAKAETNRALANLESAINANHPIGVTSDQLHKQLDDLDR